MITKVLIEKEFDVKFLNLKIVKAGFCELEINGKQGDEKDLPLYDSEKYVWSLKINVETGEVCNWELGKSVKIYEDDYSDIYWELIGISGQIVYSDYCVNYNVPNSLRIDNKRGSHSISFTINEKGFIENWKYNPYDFGNLPKT